MKFKEESFLMKDKNEKTNNQNGCLKIIKLNGAFMNAHKKQI